MALQTDNANVLQEPLKTGPIGSPPPSVPPNTIPFPPQNPTARNNLDLLHGPLQKNIPAMTQAVLAVPAGLTSKAQNLLPVIPFQVLSLLGNAPRRTWVIPLSIAGQTLISVRASYRDLHITPGIRALQISYSVGTTQPVLVKCNATGMVQQLPIGPQNLWIPLFMSAEMIDLTISCTVNIDASATALLTSEFIVQGAEAATKAAVPGGAPPYIPMEMV